MKPSSNHWNIDDSSNSDNGHGNGGHVRSADGRVNISTADRQPVQWADLEVRFGKVPFGRQMSISARAFTGAGSSFRSCSILNVIFSFFPILSWIQQYNLKSDLIGDLVGGFTVSALHLPQGMAYGLLAGVSPINGLYVSFFPAVIYAIMGTSRHTSIGTFAIASIMTRNVITKLSAPEVVVNSSHVMDSETVDPSYSDLTPLQIACTLCFTVGAIRLVMGFIKLGIISVIMSDQMVSAFSCGAAFHVATSQMPSVFGIRDGRNFSGPFKLIHIWIHLIESLDKINWVTFSTSLIGIVIIFVYKEWIDERLKRRYSVPIGVPIDLTVLLVATLVSWLLHFDVVYGVRIMGDIPSGFPPIEAPNLSIVPKMLPEAFALSMVTYAIALSVGKMFAKKYRYQIRPSQELIALGAADLLSSFMACYPCSASLSRTPVQEKAGGRSQMASLISASIIMMILLFLGPYLYYLPKCILGSIILVALKTMFMQLADLERIWRVSRVEGFCYAVTFLSVVLLDVDIGLVIGIVLAILVVLVRTTWPSISLLEQLPNTEIYVESNRFKNSLALDTARIYRFSCALFFLNGEMFRDHLFKLCFGCTYYDILQLDAYNRKCLIGKVSSVIIDCSTISYIDIIGVEILVEVFNSLHDLNIRCYLAACPATVLDMLERAKFLQKISSPKYPVFPTIHDAVSAERFSNRV